MESAWGAYHLERDLMYATSCLNNSQYKPQFASLNHSKYESGANTPSSKIHICTYVQTLKLFEINVHKVSVPHNIQ